MSKLNASDLIALKKQLLIDLEELDQNDILGATAQKTVVLDQQSVGRLSRMDALQNQAIARAQGIMRSNQRLRINTALERIEDGEYGYCDGCGEDIPKARLGLAPCAIKCVSCASG